MASILSDTAIGGSRRSSKENCGKSTPLRAAAIGQAIDREDQPAIESYL